MPDTHVVLWSETRGPSGRFLVAHALEEGCPIVTHDGAFTRSGVPVPAA